MSNCYAIITAEDVLKCTGKEADQLAEFLAEEAEDSGNAAGIEWEFYKGKNKDKGTVYLFSEEYGNPDDLSKNAKEFIGKLIKKNKKEFLEFGIAFYADKASPGTAGGNSFRIYANGEVKWAKQVWE